MRLFLDTNVWIGAVVARGLCADLVRILVSQHEFGLATVVVSKTMRGEFIRIMQNKLHASDAALVEILEIFDALYLAPEANLEVPATIPDPNDVPLVASALAGKADIFVTADKPLLELAQIADMAIRSPRAIFERLATRR